VASSVTSDLKQCVQYRPGSLLVSQQEFGELRAGYDFTFL
jgi:hypothetical protein